MTVMVLDAARASARNGNFARGGPRPRPGSPCPAHGPHGRVAEQPIRAHHRGMLGLIVALLVLWVILAILGFVIHGLVWLAIVGIILFLATGAWGWLRRRV